MADRQLSRDFWLSEFERASVRELTLAEVQAAEWWAAQILQPLRRRYGRIRITSYIRETGSGTHKNGDAIDFVFLDHDAPARQATREAVEWLGTFHPASFGKAIHELHDPDEVRDHAHVTRPGVQGAHGEVWVEQPPGTGERFAMGFAHPAVVVGLVMLALVLLLIVL